MAARDGSEGEGQELPFARTTPAPTHTLPSAAIGDRPPPDKLTRAVARARIASELFATGERVRLGRYQLLEMVGAGGMGVVWGAWDPELERRVAVKLIRSSVPAARERILIEGQALAKLSHPNVVPIYDVGIVDDQVYLVMEWVRGEDLRAYGKRRHTVRELLAVYRAAGDGLAAAHRAGLIHRDFKPDNAMVGEDGRVRVLDFGLARSEVRAPDDDELPKFASQLTRGAGTPRYMPIEQAEGRELTPAVDQYAFCVSLREALAGRIADGSVAAIPGWIATILSRGAAREAADRYPSMDELLFALARDPARRWRSRLLVIGALAATGAAFAVGSVRRGGDANATIEPCDGVDSSITQLWNDGIRENLTTALRGLGDYGSSEAARMAPIFESYSRGWSNVQRRACLAHASGASTPAIYERQLTCAARTEAAFASTIDVVRRADEKTLPDAATAVAALPSTERCLAADESAGLPPPADKLERVRELAKQLERVRVEVRAVTSRAIPMARDAVRMARELDYTPLQLEAELELGHALLAGNRGEAIELFGDTSERSFTTNATELAVHAYAHLAVLLATVDRAIVPPQAARWFAVANALPVVKWAAASLGSRSRHVRALLHESEGVTKLLSDPEQARHDFVAALDAWGKSREHVELFGLYSNLAVVTNDPKERNRLFAEAIEQLSLSLGERHPEVLALHVNRAMLTADLDSAHHELTTACDTIARSHSHLRIEIATCMYETAWLELDRGDEARATARFARVSEGDDAVIAATFREPEGRLAALHAAATADRLITRHQPWASLRAADALVVAATRDASRAVADLTEARRILATTAGEFSQREFYRRRLARIDSSLALALASTYRTQAARHARDAASWYRTAGGYQARLATLERVMGSR